MIARPSVSLAGGIARYGFGGWGIQLASVLSSWQGRWDHNISQLRTYNSNDKLKLKKQLAEVRPKISKQIKEANKQFAEVRPKISKQLKEANKQFSEVAPKLSKQIAEANKQISDAKPQIAEFTRDLYTIPNILTMTRIATTPLIGYLIVNGNTHYALLVFTYSCITDFVDGYIARKYNQKSIIGSIIDPLADKFLMTVCTISLAYVNSIPTLVASIIIGRDIMLSFMSFYYRYKSLPSPKTLVDFLDIKGKPTITVHPSTLGKLNTGLQMLYIGGLVVKPIIDPIFDSGLYFDMFAVVVSITTVLSGASYIFGKNAFKYVKKP